MRTKFMVEMGPKELLVASLAGLSFVEATEQRPYKIELVPVSKLGDDQLHGVIAGVDVLGEGIDLKSERSRNLFKSIRINFQAAFLELGLVDSNGEKIHQGDYVFCRDGGEYIDYDGELFLVDYYAECCAFWFFHDNDLSKPLDIEYSPFSCGFDFMAVMGNCTAHSWEEVKKECEKFKVE